MALIVLLNIPLTKLVTTKQLPRKTITEKIYNRNVVNVVTN